MALSKQQILVKTHGPIAYEERNAGEAGIYPGMLLKVATDGDFEKHATEGQNCQLQVALEDSLQGKVVADVYTANYPVRSAILRKGEEFLALLEAGQKVSIGERLISAGNGHFKSAEDSGSVVNYAVAEALEAEDLSGVSSVATLIHARAL